jgi:hypothetical protein
MYRSLNKLKDLRICEVCGENESVGVCCVPSVPISCAYCEECLAAGAHPWSILIANTVCCDGLHNMADFWKWMVTDTCEHLGKTLDDFIDDVNRSIKIMEAEMRSYPTKEEDMVGPGGPYR